ncbi:hypothetical protein [Methanoplanus limicola]|uniref:Uncharacterized protein n=1 Tax=Methanoplanus limicola DSM 2279 TaxID=937775 RepID=H1Z3N1_9EURY|nr:hypothetical protein [Methanoplanus limicola]EHQ35630.1 hypothetical protein Metlim_1529 [Methanoplanus limicola DSM 2279]
MTYWFDPQIKDVIGYISPNGLKVAFICPYKAIRRDIDLEDIRGGQYRYRRQNISHLSVNFVEFKTDKFPVDELARLQNERIKGSL